MGKWTEAAIKKRRVYDTAVGYLTDEQALTVKELYRDWDDLVADGKEVPLGTRFVHNGKLYKTNQEKYQFVAHYIPGSTGTESLFTVLDETHSGSIEEPIPYDGNMELEEGKYYSQNGVIYKCTRSTGTAVYHALTDLVGIYVETTG